MITGRTQRRIRYLSRILVTCSIVLAALIYIAPIVFMVVGSLKPDDRVLSEAGTIRAVVPADVSLQNYRDVFRRTDFLRFLVNSVLITGTIVITGLLVNGLAGYAFARLPWRGRDLTFAFVLAVMILPFEAIAVPLYYGITILGWRDTYIAQILPFIANPFAVYLFYTFFIGMPKEFEECARVDGAGPWRTYFTIIVPNAKPVFATVAIVTFLFYWGFFLWPTLVTSGKEVRPLPVAIATFHTLPPLQWGDILAFGVMMVAPVLIFFLVFQRWFVQGVATTGLKG